MEGGLFPILCHRGTQLSIDAVGGQEKKGMGCFLDDLRAFGINADH